MNNEHTNLPPPIPPMIPATPVPSSPAILRPPGENPGDDKPIPGLAAAFEAILRQPRRVMFQLRQPHSAKVIAALVLNTLVCAYIYGFVAGTFSGGEQLLAAPLKITGGLLLSALICLPSLYILSCLCGSQARLIEVAGLVAGLLALTAVMLLGFAPVAWVFSQSTESVVAMGALHLLFWLIATAFGLRFLQTAFDHLNARGENRPLGVWLVIFVLVVLQMTTALRPLIGTAPTLLPTEKKFFLTHWGENLRK